MTGSSTLLHRAYQQYTTDGIIELISEFPSFVARQVIEQQSISTAELQRIASEHGKIWYDEKEDPITISPPDQMELQNAFGEYTREYEPGKAFICELNSCHLISEYAVGLFEGKKLILETTANRTSNSWVGPYSQILKHSMKSRVRSQPRNNVEFIFPLVCPDPSYFHWLIEYLPKLRLYKHYCNQTGHDPVILIESNPPDYVVDTLHCAGLDPEDYIEWNKEATAVKKLIVPLHRQHRFNREKSPYTDYNPSARDLFWLRDQVRSHSVRNENKIESDKRIYISRQNAKRGRKVLNFKEMSELLDEMDFEIHRIEEYSVREQVELFSAANVIMGPHGAGLSNMVFGTDPTIVELFPDVKIEPHFYCLSEIMNFCYRPIVTQSSKNNLIVDTESIYQQLHNLGF